MTKIESNDLLTVTQAAKKRGVTRQAISHLIRQGKLPFVEIAGKKFISCKELNEYEPDVGGRPKKSGD